MKFNLKSIGVKLWLYFILFASVILIALWLLQIVFLQSFYEGMKTSSISEIANTITQHYGSEDFETTVDQITFRNSILVFLIDTDGNVIYTSDEHSRGGLGKEKSPKYEGKAEGMLTRSLPADFDSFLSRLSESDSGYISFTVNDDRFNSKTLVYGARLPDAVLYISTPLDPINSTTDILRTQLIYVTIAALFLSFVIAYFIARKFSKPVTAISGQAGRLANGEFNITFEKGFCSEIDELASTLDHTAHELSKVESLRRDLMANISHDLRTPLTMIKAYAEMIHDISGDNREKREAHLSVISSEADRLTNLVNDILELSVLQSGNGTVELVNLNLSDMVKKVISDFEPVFEHEGHNIKSSIEPDQYIHGDEQKLMQVFYNLIGNGMNYIGDDKTVGIRLIDLGGRVRFEVSDSGEGIPEDELPYIWDRYYKAKEHKNEKTGTGLGLSIVKSILELHGARFGVNSEVGSGSTFWFEITK